MLQVPFEVFFLDVFRFPLIANGHVMLFMFFMLFVMLLMMMLLMMMFLFCGNNDNFLFFRRRLHHDAPRNEREADKSKENNHGSKEMLHNNLHISS